MAKSPAWTRAEGKSPSGGLNDKGRASLRAAGHDIKRPQPEGGSRRDSFCARMKGMKAKLTSSETANDPDSRINKSLRKWNCASGGSVEADRKYRGDGGHLSSISPAANLYEELPEYSSKELDVGGYQKIFKPEDAEKLFNRGTQDVAKIVAQDWYDKNPTGTSPSDEQWVEGQQNSAATKPVDIEKRQSIGDRLGRAHVIDPEGREGHPLFVAGTTPAGKPVALNEGAQAALASHLGRIFNYYNPKDNAAGTTTRGPTQLPFGLSSNAIGRNLAQDSPLAYSVPHEVGHAIHNIQYRYKDPLEGASPNALRDFSSMADQRWKESYGSRPRMRSYTLDPREEFAEGVKAYLTDPARFKMMRPDAAKFLRDKINTDPRVNKILNLSRNEDQEVPVAANGGRIGHASGGQVWDKPRPKDLGKPDKLSPSEKRSAKASAKAAGRPYPNLVDNMRAARAWGGRLGYATGGSQDVDPYDYRSHINDLYQTYLGRQADEGGASFWEQQLRNTPLTLQDISNQFASSAEGKGRAEQIVDQIYRDRLGRDPDAAGRQFWADQIRSGNQRMSDLYRSFDQNREALLNDIYRQELGRDLDEGARNYWMNTGQADPDWAALRDQIAGSEEARNRAKNIASDVSRRAGRSFNTDLDALAGVLWSEGDILRAEAQRKGLPDIGENELAKIGWSVRNRAASGFKENMGSAYARHHDPYSLIEQIYAPSAYSGFGGGRQRQAAAAFEKDPELASYYKDVARRIMTGELKDPTGGRGISYYNEKAVRKDPKFSHHKDWQFLEGSATDRLSQHHRFYDNPHYSERARAMQDRNLLENPNLREMTPAEQAAYDKIRNIVPKWDPSGNFSVQTMDNALSKALPPPPPPPSTYEEAMAQYRREYDNWAAQVRNWQIMDAINNKGRPAGGVPAPLLAAEPKPPNPANYKPATQVPAPAPGPNVNPGASTAVPGSGMVNPGGGVVGPAPAPTPGPTSSTWTPQPFATGSMDAHTSIQNMIQGNRLADQYSGVMNTGGGPGMATPSGLPSYGSTAPGPSGSFGVSYMNTGGRVKRADGGEVSHLDRLMSEITDRTMAERAKYDTGPKEGEPVLKAGPEPSTWDTIRDKLMGDRPSPERRRFVEGLGDIADVAHMGAYATPAAPYVGAADMAHGLATGDRLETLMSAAGLPGRAAKMAGVAAGAMAPDEAQAGPLDRFVRKGADILAKDLSMAGVGPKFRSANIKSAKPFSEYEVQGEKIPGYLAPWRGTSIEEHQGKWVAPLLSDLSGAGERITHIGGRELSSPFETHGGGDFTRGPSSRGATPAAWASTAPAAKTYQKKLAAVVPEGEEVIGVHAAMGKPASDSSDMMVKALLRQMQAASPTKKGVTEFDKLMEEKIPGWTGVMNRETEDFLMGLPFSKRHLPAKWMDKAKWMSEGFPDVGETRFAITEPRLMNAPHLTSGYSVAKLNPRAGVMKDVEVQHPNYPGHMPTVGDEAYLGGFTSPVHASKIWNKWWENLSPKAKKRGGEPMAMRGLLTQFPIEKIDQEMVDRVMADQELHKKMFGWRKGGRVTPSRKPTR